MMHARTTICKLVFYIHDREDLRNKCLKLERLVCGRLVISMVSTKGGTMSKGENQCDSMYRIKCIAHGEWLGSKTTT